MTPAAAHSLPVEAAAPRPAAAMGVALLLLMLGLASALALRWPAGDGAGVDAAPAVAGSPEARLDALQRHLARNPRDGRGWVLLGMLAFEADRYAEAAQAFERAVAVSSRVAADPAVWCDYADAVGMAQGGVLAGRPTELIQRALAIRADHPKALEMAGSAAYERREFVLAADHWRRLSPQLAEGSRERAQLGAAIERAEMLAKTSLR